MIDIIQLLVPVVILILPMLAGAFKQYYTIKIARIVTDFACPTISSLVTVYYIDLILINTKVISEHFAYLDILYVCSLIVSAVLLWYGFFRLVEFGSNISSTHPKTLQYIRIDAK